VECPVIDFDAVYLRFSLYWAHACANHLIYLQGDGAVVAYSEMNIPHNFMGQGVRERKCLAVFKLLRGAALMDLLRTTRDVRGPGIR